MKQFIVIAMIMACLGLFICNDLGNAANQGPNLHNYKGTNTMIAHSAAEISSTPTGGVTATNVQDAIIQMAVSLGFQTATQTSITTIVGLVATNVQTALAEIVSVMVKTNTVNTFTKSQLINTTDGAALQIALRNLQGVYVLNGSTPYAFGIDSETNATDSVAIYASCTAPGGTGYALQTVGPVKLGSLASGTGTDLVSGTGGIVLLKSSSKKFKHDIRIMEDKTLKLSLLKPVNFKWNRNNANDFGLIAEEVYKVYPELVNLDADGKPTSVTYDKLSVILLQKVLKLEAEIKQLKKK